MLITLILFFPSLSQFSDVRCESPAKSTASVKTVSSELDLLVSSELELFDEALLILSPLFTAKFWKKLKLSLKGLLGVVLGGINLRYERQYLTFRHYSH